MIGTTDFTPFDDAAIGVSIQADGKNVLAGISFTGAHHSKLAVAQYQAS